MYNNNNNNHNVTRLSYPNWLMLRELTYNYLYILLSFELNSLIQTLRIVENRKNNFCHTRSSLRQNVISASTPIWKLSNSSGVKVNSVWTTLAGSVTMVTKENSWKFIKTSQKYIYISYYILYYIYKIALSMNEYADLKDINTGIKFNEAENIWSTHVNAIMYPVHPLCSFSVPLCLDWL